MELRGRRCLVTGAAGGIGSACVVALRAAGADVLGVDKEYELPGDASRLAAEAGAVDVLVNCAGAGLFGPVSSVSLEDARRVLAVNLEAPVTLTRLLLPGMLERRSGHVVNIASLVAHVPKRLEAVYAASKSGLAGFTRSLHAELRGSGVGASLVSPAVVDTGFFDARGEPYARRWPRPVTPSRVADAVVDAIRHDRAEVVVPGWLTVAVRLYGAAPGLYRAVSARFD